jgi:ABC-type lipoprotein release transport system permease subunit
MAILTGGLTVVASLACIIPAVQAANADPLHILRED